MDIVIIRYQGKLWRIPKVRFETEERAKDRGWWIIKNAGSIDLESLSASHRWANEKYFGMKYN
jgi:hypothetical protein